MTAIIWYRNGSGPLNYTTRNITFRVKRKDNKLVSVLNKTYQAILLVEKLIVDAIKSFDDYFLGNRNFTYIWTCPGNLTKMMLCTSTPTLTLS